MNCETPPQAEILRNPRAVKEAKLELLREMLHELLGFVGLHANVCQTLTEAGDDTGAIYSLSRLIIRQVTGVPNHRGRSL